MNTDRTCNPASEPQLSSFPQTENSRDILNYIRGILTHIPMLKRMIERETAEGFDLNNGVTIEIHTASWRSTEAIPSRRAG